MDLGNMQSQLRQSDLDGWLFYDFHVNNPIAYEVLGFSPGIASRRWFYFVPTNGTPTKIVSAVEPHALTAVPGSTNSYRTWQELHSALGATLNGVRNVAMEYSPNNSIPYLSRVDAGTVELVRSFGTNVVSSAALAQQLVSVLDAKGQESHRQAGLKLMAAKDALFEHISKALSDDDGSLHEYGIQQHMIRLMESEGLVLEEPPIIAVNAHAGDPHYTPTAESSIPLRRGDLLLVDYWAKLPAPDDIYADYTWMAFAGTKAEIPQPMADVFAVAASARDAGIDFMRERIDAGKSVTGGEVDDVVRNVVRKADLGEYFVHRTGHSITTHVHGNGAHLDNFETVDTRELLPNTCNSVEPGIYLADFGVRTETDTLITASGVEVTGGQLQTEITPLL